MKLSKCLVGILIIVNSTEASNSAYSSCEEIDHYSIPECVRVLSEQNEMGPLSIIKEIKIINDTRAIRDLIVNSTTSEVSGLQLRAARGINEEIFGRECRLYFDKWIKEKRFGDAGILLRFVRRFNVPFERMSEQSLFGIIQTREFSELITGEGRVLATVYLSELYSLDNWQHSNEYRELFPVLRKLCEIKPNPAELYTPQLFDNLITRANKGDGNIKK